MGRGREVGPASRYQHNLLAIPIRCYSSSYSASRKRSPVEQDSICMHIYVYFSMWLGQVAVASASPRATYDVIDATPSPASVKDVYCATVYDRGGPRVAVTVSSTAKHDIRDGGYICFFFVHSSFPFELLLRYYLVQSASKGVRRREAGLGKNAKPFGGGRKKKIGDCLSYSAYNLE